MASSLCNIVDSNGQSRPLHIITKMASTVDHVSSNIKINIRRPIQRFINLPGLLHARNQPIAIVGGGPSVNQYLDEIRKFEHVMVCGSAHDHMVNKGVPFDFALAVDPADDAVQWIQKPQKNTSYLLASQCHPNLYEKLEGHKIAMWNFGGQTDDDPAHFGNEPIINWGCMVGVHSIQMALYLGFQHLHFFGLDCSYIEDAHHAYDVGKYHAESEEKKLTFTVNGRPFVSTMALMSQAEHIFDVFGSSDGQFIKGYVYGDGMLANIIKASPPEMKEWLEAA